MGSAGKKTREDIIADIEKVDIILQHADAEENIMKRVNELGPEYWVCEDKEMAEETTILIENEYFQVFYTLESKQRIYIPVAINEEMVSMGIEWGKEDIVEYYTIVDQCVLDYIDEQFVCN